MNQILHGTQMRQARVCHARVRRPDRQIRQALNLSNVLKILIRRVMEFQDAAFADDPDNFLVLFLSMFPFSSPSAMVTRMAVTTVPAWQVLLSLLMLLLTTYAVLMMASRFFHPQNLLSQAQFSWRRLVTAWRENE